MATTLQITPPGGVTDTIIMFSRCTVTLSTTSKTGSFSVDLEGTDESIYDKYPIGSDVRINMDGNVFRGWVLNPTKQLNGQIKTLNLKGLCYAGKTQKILVTETYVNQTINYIVKDLFTKYASEYNQDSIAACNKIISSIKFNDEFLFDVMEELATLAGYEWFIDEPVPDTVDTETLPSGWAEIVDTFIHEVNYPSVTLYPSEVLYPC